MLIPCHLISPRPSHAHDTFTTPHEPWRSTKHMAKGLTHHPQMPVVWALRPKFRPIVNAKPRPAEHDVLLANNGQVYASPTCIADKWNQMGSLRR